MLINKAGNVVDLAVDDHVKIISVLVFGNLLEGEGLLVLNGDLLGNGLSGGRHCVSCVFFVGRDRVNVAWGNGPNH